MKLPVVLGRESKDASLKVLLDKQELGALNKDHGRFLESLRRKASDEGITGLSSRL